MVEKLTVIGLPGDGGYWQMANDLFDIDWDLLDERDIIVITNSVGLERSPKLTAREAAALLAGLQLARTIPGVGDTDLFSGLLAKLARGASSTPADVIVVPGPVDEVRDTVAAALQRQVAVSFTYKAPDAAPTTRTVDPGEGAHRRRPVVPAGLVPPAAGDAHVPPRPRERPRADRHPDHPRRGAGPRMVRRGCRRRRRAHPVPGIRRAAARRLSRTRRRRDDGRRGGRDHARRRRAEPASPRGPSRRRSRDPRTGGAHGVRPRTGPKPASPSTADRLVASLPGAAVRGVSAGYNEG